MRVNVTQEDIDKGERGSCYLCPVALALSRATSLSAYLDEEEIILSDHLDVATHYEVPQSVLNFMAAFDCGSKPAPFSFELKQPTL